MEFNPESAVPHGEGPEQPVKADGILQQESSDGGTGQQPVKADGTLQQESKHQSPDQQRKGQTPCKKNGQRLE